MAFVTPGGLVSIGSGWYQLVLISDPEIGACVFFLGMS